MKVSAIPSAAAKQQKRSSEIDRVRRQSFELTSPPFETTTGDNAFVVPPKIRQKSGSAINRSTKTRPPPFQRSVSANELNGVKDHTTPPKQHYSPQLLQVMNMIHTLSGQDRELLILYLHESERRVSGK